MGGKLSQRLAASFVAREVFAVNLFDCSLSIMNLSVMYNSRPLGHETCME